MTPSARLRPLAWTAAALAASAVAPGRLDAQADPAPRVVPGRYIVVLRDGAPEPGLVAAQMARAHGAAVDAVYRSVLRGFAGAIPPGRVATVAADPRVAWVEPDQVAELQGKLVALAKPGGNGGTPPPETVPVGVARIYSSQPALIPPSVAGVNVAVIDSGIDARHVDLNVLGGFDVTRSRSGYNDGYGHGTHVAGTIAAARNAQGVVGVAPGAGLYAVKVMNDRGLGSASTIIAGLEWVKNNAGPNHIKVANMSVGVPSSPALNAAVDEVVAAGVLVVVAAGNSRSDCRGTSPANSTNPGVLTVSALVETDGFADGRGPSTSSGPDEFIANFSNNGRNEPAYGDLADNGVDLIAPGVNVLSTYKGGGYATMSGTSMAAPHVAGTAALFFARSPSATPDDARMALITAPNADSYEFGGIDYWFGLAPWRAIGGDLDSDGPQGYEPLVRADTFVTTPE